MVCCDLNMIKVVLMMNSRESDVIPIITCYFNRVNKLCSYVGFLFFSLMILVNTCGMMKLLTF